MSEGLPIIRLSTPADRDAILAFIERSGFNPRDAITWDKLNMQAMTAWIADELVGIIPFEPRRLRISADRTIHTIHETVVAVEEQHRGGGLGSRMQSALARSRPNGAELITVFREDPVSAAYRWYRRNGFVPLMNIESWFCDVPTESGGGDQVWRIEDACAVRFGKNPADAEIFDSRGRRPRLARGNCGRPGPPPPAIKDSSAFDMFFVERQTGQIVRDLQPWLAVHPYRNRYQFWIVADEAGSAALLGVGTMHSETLRADVLDWIRPSTSLVRSVATAASRNQWQPVRIALAKNDPAREIVRSMGFERRWSFDMLGRPLVAELDRSQLPTSSWKYAGIDYI